MRLNLSRCAKSRGLEGLPTDGKTRASFAVAPSVRVCLCVRMGGGEGGLRVRLQWLPLNVAFMALPRKREHT